MDAAYSKNSFYRGCCRCCGTITECRILTHEYKCLGQKEIYADMLLNCFGIDLTYLESDLDDRLVCTACVSRMRVALTFKMQVLKTEEAFLQRKISQPDVKQHQNTALKPRYPQCPSELVKVELLQNLKNSDENLDLDNMADGLDDELTPELLKEYHMLGRLNPEMYDDDFTLLFNTIQAHKRKRPVTVARPKVVLPPANPMQDTSSDEDVLSNIKNNMKVAKLMTEPRAGHGTMKDDQATSAGMDKSPKKPKITTKEMNFMRDTNLRSIVKYSYVCPFKCRFNHILCYYCLQNFVDPDLLREHTLTHDPKTFKINRSNRNTKIDLTRIDCRLCPEKIEDLEAFKRHLVSVHGKKHYMESKDNVLPFRLVKDDNKCAICSVEFPSFHVLSKHMNEHFSNYVCETCGLGFMEELALLKHGAEHEARRFACKTCGKTFKSKYMRMLHIKRIHTKSAGSFCTKCDKFLLLNEKARHMVEVHGESPTVPCIACDKVFKSRRLLTYHLRREHMKAYKFACQMCPRKFYTSESLRYHMPTHTGERNFKCKVCEKTYPRMKTLKQHMRIHNNDRRYKCTICGQAFVQNCSLKGHMKSKHPEYGYPE